VVHSFEAIHAAAREALEIEDPWEAFEHVLWRGAQIMAADRALSEVFQSEPRAFEAALPAVAGLHETVAKVMRRAQAAGELRADAVIDDIPMLMCGIGAATKKEHSAAEPWRRHMIIVLDGLRASSATRGLPG
jgi:hypothetical protein